MPERPGHCMAAQRGAPCVVEGVNYPP